MIGSLFAILLNSLLIAIVVAWAVGRRGSSRCRSCGRSSSSPRASAWLIAWHVHGGVAVNSDDVVFGRVVRNGVLTLSGNAPSSQGRERDAGCARRAACSAGRGRGRRRRSRTAWNTRDYRGPAARSGTIVVTRPDGFITFAAIEWLHEVGVSLVQLDWHGDVLACQGRRPAPIAQRCAGRKRSRRGSATGLAIMREILRHKLAGQAAVARLLGGEDTAALIERMGC